jgi:predicted lipase
MSNYDQLLKHFSHYERLLLSSVIVSEIIYDKKPIKKLNDDEFANFNYYIDKATVKETEYVNYVEDSKMPITYPFKMKYLCCKKSKLMIVAFRGTKLTDADDLITDVDAVAVPFSPDGSPNIVNDMGPKVHRGFLIRSTSVDIGYFVEKILDRDYKVVFTGHSLGAAIAALVAVKVLFHHRIKKEKSLREKVFFIGFGCPALGNSFFCDIVNRRCQNNFHFYVNKNDLVTTTVKGVFGTFTHFGTQVNFPSDTNILASFFVQSVPYLTGHAIINYRNNIVRFLREQLLYEDIYTKEKNKVEDY